MHTKNPIRRFGRHRAWPGGSGPGPGVGGDAGTRAGAGAGAGAGARGVRRGAGAAVTVVLALCLAFGASLATAGAASASSQTDPTIFELSSENADVKVIDSVNTAVQHTIALGQARPGVLVMSANGAFAYTSNFGSNNVSVIDAAANAVTATIPVGTQPESLALTPDGSQLWVPNYGDNTVSVIDTSINRVVFTFPTGLGSRPIGIAFSPDGQSAYVALYGSAQVAVISTAAVADARANGYSVPVPTVAVGNGPWGLAVTPNGTTVYAANYGDGTVSVISTAANTVAATVRVGSLPYKLLVAASGSQVLVSNGGSASVSVISTASNTVTTTIPVGADPQGMTASQDGSQVFVADHNAGDIEVIVIPGDTVSRSITGYGENSQDVAFRPTASASTGGASATTTTLTASPAGSGPQGSAVTLTATLTPAAATGSVTFYDGTQALGAPVFAASGTAALSVSTLALGHHALSARFTPSTSSYAGSTSQSVPYIVNSPSAAATTTALAASPSSVAPASSPVTLTATVSPATAPGAVQFTDTVNGTTSPLGAPVPVGSGGLATLTTTALTAGNHQIGAEFTPADTTAFTISDSAAVAYQITAPAGGSAGEGVTTTVLPGALVISVADRQVVLPSPVLTAAGDQLTTSGPMSAVTLTDTRAGNAGWTVSCQVTDFSDGAGDAISGENLGFTPSITDLSAAQTAAPGAAVPPAAAVEATDAGQAGLKSPRTLVTGRGLGTAHFGAGLALDIPTDTRPGTYTATLTITAI